MSPGKHISILVAVILLIQSLACPLHEQSESVAASFQYESLQDILADIFNWGTTQADPGDSPDTSSDASSEADDESKEKDPESDKFYENLAKNDDFLVALRSRTLFFDHHALTSTSTKVPTPPPES